MGKYAHRPTHKGKRMLFANVAGMGEAEYIAALSASILHFADSVEEGKDWLAEQDDEPARVA